MTQRISQTLPMKKKRMVGGPKILCGGEVAFFDEKPGKLYNYIVNRKETISFTAFSFPVLPCMATKSSNKHHTFSVCGFTSLKMGIIPSGGEAV